MTSNSRSRWTLGALSKCHSDDAPGYTLLESPGSRKWQNFVVGDGGNLANQGEKHLNLAAPKDGGAISLVTSKFQIANVTRPLMSVGHICDQGLSVNFTPLYALVVDDKNQEVSVSAQRERVVHL